MSGSWEKTDDKMDSAMVSDRTTDVAMEDGEIVDSISPHREDASQLSRDRDVQPSVEASPFQWFCHQHVRRA